MRTSILIALLLATTTIDVHSQTRSNTPRRTHPPAGTPVAAPAAPVAPLPGAVEGELTMIMATGGVGRMAGTPVHLVPIAVVRSLAEQCATRDSARARHLRLRRPVRVAFDSARSTRGQRSAAFLARADSARAVATAALEPALRAEAEILDRIRAQRSVRTGADARFEFDSVPPGEYVLFSELALPYYWFATIDIAPGRITHNLTDHDVTPVTFDRGESVGLSVCLAAKPKPVTVDEATGPAVEEQRPELLNRAVVQRALERHYPRALRGASGSVTVRMKVLADGTVDPESIMAVSDAAVPEEARAETEAAAENVAERMRFNPAMLDNQAVAVWIVIPVQFNTLR